MADLLRFLAAWFIIFVIYSFAGWLIEIIVTSIENRKVGNRGFLIGPICPIYGFGAMIFSLLIRPDTNWFIIFCTALVCSGMLEYFTGLIMEKLFHARWWDYSEVPFNLNGRICLRNLVAFGLLGVFVIRIGNPLLTHILSSIPSFVLYIIAAVMLGALILDIIISLRLMVGFRTTIKNVSGDATAEIKERVHEIIMHKGKLNRRLAKAFSTMQPQKTSPHKKSRSTKPRA